MPRIFDNISQKLLPALQETAKLSYRGDFCVGYFNLRGWKHLDPYIEQWDGEGGRSCRLLVGMQRLPEQELREALSLVKNDRPMDHGTALRLKNRMAEEFRAQLTVGAPTNEDEAGLRRLAERLCSGKLAVRLFLKHPLHAKLYLLYRHDPINPVVGYLGSSNLTFAGLARQGELNIDVLDGDAAGKLSQWFEDRWTDRLCVDISKELIEVIERSWIRPVLPFHIYIKMAYHLSHEARAGLSEFRIPRDFGDELFEYQQAAVKIAAHHLNKRNGVLIGDVVGLGKTLMACAVARIMEDDHYLETLIICPKNLVKMWEDYRDRYRMRARVLSISRVLRDLPNLRRHRVVLIDESHNLRNRSGKKFRAIQEYIRENESKVILLTATPYNKTYLDLSNQLRLFVPEDEDIGIRPECLLREIGVTEFQRRHQCSVRSLDAFEKSQYSDDWRELMRLYLVRRTRSFIQDNYAEVDPETNRRYLTFADGTRNYFPSRIPKTIKFPVRDGDPDDQYARMFSTTTVDKIASLSLPRYGLGNYLADLLPTSLSEVEHDTIADLSRAGKRLMGFCRTNLFKRLESSGKAFLQSVERHVVRNYVFVHAIENGLPIPIGTQDTFLLDARLNDSDEQPANQMDLFDDEDENDTGEESGDNEALKRTVGGADSLREVELRQRAAKAYAFYAEHQKRRYRWLPAPAFIPALQAELESDSRALLSLLEIAGDWDAGRDAKLVVLADLVTRKHAGDKVIIFTQFADTAYYLESQLRSRGVDRLATATGDVRDPTELAWRFSPSSNQRRQQVSPGDELRVLISTDVLSEGQNLQDGFVVVNYDVPWAIIRLIQRAGRVDRIGQQASDILCYTFLPADGVNRIIRLRERIRQRLRENAEVVGTDESFFEDDRDDQAVVDLYNEKAGILDGDDEAEVDLASYAYQIWKNATTADPTLLKVIPELEDVVYSSRPHEASTTEPAGALVYVRTGEGNDALTWVDTKGECVTESQFAILQAARCAPDAPAAPHHANHHELVWSGVEEIVRQEKTVGGGLGRPSGARFRTYERLKHYAEDVKGTLFASQELAKALEDVYRYPLKQSAVDTLNRQLRSGIDDAHLADLVIALRDDDRLCLIHEEDADPEPRIICSLGLVAASSE